MEEIIKGLEQIEKAIKDDSFPLWLTIIFAIVPIVLTIVSIVLSCRMDKQNKKLQVTLSERDTKNQTRQCILDIYNTYLAAFHLSGQANDNVAEIFVSDQSYYSWATDIESKSKDLMCAYNRAKLLINDDELVKALKEGFDAFANLKGSVVFYISTGIPTRTIQNAWQNFKVSHPNVQMGNYYALYQDSVLGNEFKKLCSNSYTEEIQKNIGIYLTIVGCDDFDNKFKKYLQI